MASRYPTRNCDPVRRFGFDDVDLDASDDRESDEDRDDNILPPNGDSSDESSSDSDDEDLRKWFISFPQLTALQQLKKNEEKLV